MSERNFPVVCLRTLLIFTGFKYPSVCHSCATMRAMLIFWSLHARKMIRPPPGTLDAVEQHPELRADTERLNGALD